MLHVLIGATCNNNCLFCMESDRTGRSMHIAVQSPEDVRAMIFSYPGNDEILFTSGEPSLSPHILQYVEWAREKGFEVIGMISNGRRFAYKHFVEQLVDRGLNRATVSLHGHEAKLHDALTRAPGSFDQARAGLLNLVAVGRHKPLRVHTSTVVNRRNLPQVEHIFELLQSIGVDSIVFNVMMAKGRGAQHLAALMPRYSDVVAVFCELHERVGDQQLRKVRVVDVPPCIMAKLPMQLQGELEQFDQYELIGSTGLNELSIASVGCDNSRPARAPQASGPLQEALDTVGFDNDGMVLKPGAHWRSWRWWRGLLRGGLANRPHGLQAFQADDQQDAAAGVLADLQQSISQTSLVGDQRYYSTSRQFKDRFLRAKGEPCASCVLRRQCPGVWEPYPARYGWSEFTPLTGDDSSGRNTPETSNRRD